MHDPRASTSQPPERGSLPTRTARNVTFHPCSKEGGCTFKTGSQIGAQGVAIESLVRQQGGEVEILQKRGDTHAIGPLPRQHDEAYEIAQRINQSDDLGRQATARTPDGLILGPPFAPVPC